MTVSERQDVTGPARQGSPSTQRVCQMLRGNAIVIVTVLLILVLALTTDRFATVGNARTILLEASVGFVAAIGFTYLIVMGEIDLSVGAIYGLAGTVCGYLVMEGVPVPLCMLAGLFVSLLLGAMNGAFVVFLGINSIIVTIGTLTLVRGLIGVMTNEMGGTIYPSAFRKLSQANLFGWSLMSVLAVVLVIVLTVAERRLSLFRKVYYIGENRRSAVLYGINEMRIRFFGFVISALCAGTVGIFAAARAARGDITLGNGLEFNLLVAAVVGGVSLYGGRGRAYSTFMGMLFVTVILTALVMHNVEPLFQTVIVGTMLLVAVTLDGIAGRNLSGGSK